MNVKVLFEDNSIAVCVKEYGVLSEEEGMPMLLHEQLGGDFYPVHRLDKDVGGVMVYARSKSAAAKLSRAISDRCMDKEYLAVIHGVPADGHAVLSDLLYHDRIRNKTFVVDRMRNGVKKAELEYSVLQSLEGMSLIKVRLFTGRSHQIRVQFASRRMPIIGDRKYGSTVNEAKIALFSNRLEFPHPDTGKLVSFECVPDAVKPWIQFDLFKELINSNDLQQR